MTTSVVITDTSVLINFLALEQLHVLSQLTEFDFSVTEHVRAEITEHFSEQLQRLNAAFEAGSINEICVTDIVEVRLFAELAIAFGDVGRDGESGTV
jgi:predicted nucleic acid-binding protein